MKPKEIIEEAILLPVEERAAVVDSILKSFNSPGSDIDKKWADVAKRRFHEIDSGKISVIPGEIVFEKIWNRYST